MADVDSAPRDMRLKPEAVVELRGLRDSLLAKARLGVVTEEEATRAFMDAMAQLVRNPAALTVDDGEWYAVKCRRCFRPTNVAKDVTHYACRCTPTVKRSAYIDMLDATGEWIVDPDKLPIGA